MSSTLRVDVIAGEAETRSLPLGTPQASERTRPARAAISFFIRESSHILGEKRQMFFECLALKCCEKIMNTSFHSLRVHSSPARRSQVCVRV